MTDAPDAPDPLDPLDPLVEVASAVLDGTATPEEAARARTDPELAARVDALRGARDALQAGHQALVDGGVDQERREQALAAALAAFDEEAASGAETVSGAAAHGRLAPVVLPRGRPRAQPRTWLVGIAAAVALLALAVPVLGALSGESDDEESSETAADVLADEDHGGDAAAGSAREESADEGTTSMESSAEAADGTGAALPHLGAVQSWPELADAVARARQAAPLAADSTTTPSSAFEPGAAVPTAATCPDAADGARFIALADYGGQPLIVRVIADSAGVERIQGLDPVECDVVLEIGIDG